MSNTFLKLLDKYPGLKQNNMIYLNRSITLDYILDNSPLISILKIFVHNKAVTYDVLKRIILICRLIPNPFLPILQSTMMTYIEFKELEKLGSDSKSEWTFKSIYDNIISWLPEFNSSYKLHSLDSRLLNGTWNEVELLLYHNRDIKHNIKNLELLYLNKSITIDKLSIIKMYIGYLDYSLLSTNPNITFNYVISSGIQIEKCDEKDRIYIIYKAGSSIPKSKRHLSNNITFHKWSWHYLSMNTAISIDDIHENKDLPWDWNNIISYRNDLTVDFVKANIHLDDDNMKMLAINSSFTLDELLQLNSNIDLWISIYINSNPNATLKQIQQYKHLMNNDILFNEFELDKSLISSLEYKKDRNHIRDIILYRLNRMDILPTVINDLITSYIKFH